MIKLKANNLDTSKVKKSLSEYSKKAQERAGLVIAEAALLIHGEAVKSIQAIRSKGNERPDGSFASKPGMPPNTDTGTLVKSLNVDIDMKKAESKVYSNEKYAAWLENGTLKMAARPFLAPALQMFYVRIVQALAEALKRGGKTPKI